MAKTKTVKRPIVPVLTPEDIRGIQHQMVERRKVRRAIRAQFRAEIAQEQAFRDLLREMREDLGGSLTHAADAA